MKLQMYAVFDVAVKAFMPPMFFRAKGEAVRSFIAACNEENSQFRKHAADYSFFYVGEYDDGSAAFSMPSVPEPVITALQCIEDNTLFPPDKRISM